MIVFSQQFLRIVLIIEQVFINPMVASLPQHAHLMAEVRLSFRLLFATIRFLAHHLQQTDMQLYRCNKQHGCYGHEKGVECGKEGTLTADLSALPDSYKPIQLTEAMDEAWLKVIKDLPL